MRKPFTLILFLSSLFTHGQSVTTPVVNEINTDSLRSYIYNLSSPIMSGRKVGEHGCMLAADYISSVFRTNNLDSLDLFSNYQLFKLYNYNNGKADIRFQYLNKKSGINHTIALTNNINYIAFDDIQLNDTLELTYLGFSKSFEQDLSDKAVMLLLENNLQESLNLIDSIHNTTGAKVFILGFKKIGRWYHPAQKLSLENINKYGKAFSLMHNITNFSDMNNFEGRQELLNPISRIEKSNYIVVFEWPHIYPYLLNHTAKELFQQEKRKNATIKYNTQELYCNINANKLTKDSILARNVIGFIQGSDKTEETIVVSAHYDHLGRKSDSLIFFGADDNASGISAMLEIARVLQLSADKGLRPRRNIMFVAFDAEEIGLMGAEYFCNNIPNKSSSIIMNINLDMIGRERHDQSKYHNTVFMIADGKNKRYYKRTIKDVNKKMNTLQISRPSLPFQGMAWKNTSDHKAFKDINIPFVHFHTGMHSDYHSPRDTPDKINYQKLTEISKVLLMSVWQIANSEKQLNTKNQHTIYQ